MPKLTKRQLKEEFNKFLRENGCASKFYVNFYHPKAKRWRKERRVLHDFKYGAIIYAFLWGESPEKINYWEILDDIWRIRYRKLTA